MADVQLGLRWGGATHRGRVRSVNQDSLHADESLFVVADGMGGHRGGEVASKVAVDTLQGQPRDSVDELAAAVSAANRAIFDMAAENDELNGMGTTVATMAVLGGDPPTMALANVGDSRVYRLRAGTLEQLTEDHNYVADLVKQGQLSPEKANDHPYRNMLTRAVGVDQTVEVDRWEIDVEHDDRYLLCSDGLFSEVAEDELTTLLVDNADPTDAARALISAANEAGGHDNVTAVIVDVVGEDELDEPKLQTQVGSEQSNVPTLPAPDPQPPPTELSRGFTWRVLLFAVAIVAVLTVVAGLIGWYARGAYYVAFLGTEVVVYQGRPGGVLWFDPTLEVRTGITRQSLPPASVAEVDANHETSTLDGAKAFVDQLSDQVTAQAG